MKDIWRPVQFLPNRSLEVFYGGLAMLWHKSFRIFRMDPWTDSNMTGWERVEQWPLVGSFMRRPVTCISTFWNGWRSDRVSQDFKSQFSRRSWNRYVALSEFLFLCCCCVAYGWRKNGLDGRLQVDSHVFLFVLLSLPRCLVRVLELDFQLHVPRCHGGHARPRTTGNLRPYFWLVDGYAKGTMGKNR